MFMKHVAMLKNTGKDCVILFLEIPGKEDHSLVVEPKSLPDRLHDQVVALLESNEGQSALNFGEVLGRRFLADGSRTILEELHLRNYLYRVPHENLMLVPNRNSRIEMTDFIRSLRDLRSGKLPSDNFTNNATSNATSEVTRTSVSESFSQNNSQEVVANSVRSENSSTSMNPMKEIPNPLRSSNVSSNEATSIAMNNLQLARLLLEDAMNKIAEAEKTALPEVLKMSCQLREMYARVLFPVAKMETSDSSIESDSNKETVKETKTKEIKEIKGKNTSKKKN